MVGRNRGKMIVSFAFYINPTALKDLHFRQPTFWSRSPMPLTSVSRYYVKNNIPGVKAVSRQESKSVGSKIRHKQQGWLRGPELQNFCSFMTLWPLQWSTTATAHLFGRRQALTLLCRVLLCTHRCPLYAIKWSVTLNKLHISGKKAVRVLSGPDI